ncbi:MAG: hypothetical protein MJZ84_02955 [Paludibacteraceae bacterium]|nr:hypothetical protein [Paludibacteraceae bacterium]
MIITQKNVEKKLDEIRSRGDENADIYYPFLPRPYRAIEDFVTLAKELLGRIISDCQSYFNDFSKKSLYMFYCNELLIKIIKPSFCVHRTLNHTLLYNYAKEIAELSEMVKQIIMILEPENSIDDDLICVEDKEWGDCYYSRVQLMEVVLSDMIQNCFNDYQSVDTPLTDKIKKYDILYQEWEQKTTEIIMEQIAQFEKRHPNATEELKYKTIAALLRKYKDFYLPISDNRNMTWDKILDEIQNKKSCHIEAKQKKILQNCFRDLNKIDSLSVQLVLLGVLKMSYGSLISLNNNHRQHRVNHELHEPLVNIEREWHKAYISIDFVEEIESLDEISKESLIKKRKEYEGQLYALKDRNGEQLKFGPYTNKKAIELFWNRVYQCLGFGDMMTPDFELVSDDFLILTGKIDLIDELMEILNHPESINNIDSTIQVPNATTVNITVQGDVEKIETPANNVIIPQSGSTTNVGCDQRESKFTNNLSQEAVKQLQTDNESKQLN